MLLKKPATNASVLQFPARRKPQGPQGPDSTPNAITIRRIGILSVTREKIGHAFLSVSRMETIRVGYRLPMAAVEEVIREEMRARLAERRAA
jgi:hypothetical protein